MILDFGLEEAFREHLVCGKKSFKIQKRLMAARNLSLTFSFETAQSKRACRQIRLSENLSLQGNRMRKP